MVTASPGLNSPMDTAKDVSPGVLPLVIVPTVAVTDPTTREVLGSGVSVNTTPVAALPPVLLIRTE